MTENGLGRRIAYKPTVAEANWKPLSEVKVNGYRLRKGQLVSVRRRPGLVAGRYEFRWAEYTNTGVLFLHVEGPISGARRWKTITEADIKTVHVQSEAR
jgi:hypothetical protein